MRTWNNLGTDWNNTATDEMWFLITLSLPRELGWETGLEMTHRKDLERYDITFFSFPLSLFSFPAY